MLLNIILWACFAILVLGVIILIIESQKETRARSVLVASMLLMLIAAIAAILAAGISTDTDIAYELEDNQVYYLNATVPAPENPQFVSLIVLKTDTVTGEFKNPIIVVNRISKDRLAQGVEPGKYIKKGAKGKIEVWTAPIKT